MPTNGLADDQTLSRVSPLPPTLGTGALGDRRGKSSASVRWRNIKRDRYLLLLIAPVLVYFLVFHYGPMFGAVIAFKNYKPGLGIWGSPWVGFDHFTDFFDSFYFERIVRNTLLLNLFSLVWGFPAPVIFALLLNEVRGRLFKRTVQTVSYLPHFISVVVITGMVVTFLSPADGIINKLLVVLGFDKIDFMSQPEFFPFHLCGIRDLAGVRLGRHHLPRRSGRD